MAEVEQEAAHIRCHELRIAVSFASMRHFCEALPERGIHVHYSESPFRRSQDRGAGLA